MIPISFLVVNLLLGLAQQVPNLLDANGWSLRVEKMAHGPFIVGETHDNVRIKITLINKSAQVRPYPPLDSAVKANELYVDLRYSDSRKVRSHFEPDVATRPEHWVKMEEGKSVSIELALKNFGYRQFIEPGKYWAQLKFKSPQGEVTSFPWVLDVVEPDATNILANHEIPLDAFEERQKANTLSKAFVQQIKLGDRVFLVYRSFGRGSNNKVVPDRCIRLTELPGKVDMKVTGEYGRGKTITVTFDDNKAPDGKRSIVIDSK